MLSAIRGKNVVMLHGACLEPKPCLVMEYCSGGSLYDLLQDTKLEIGWRETLRFASEMATGIHVLHNNEPQILHRDLKSMNFLVTYMVLFIFQGYKRLDYQSRRFWIIAILLQR